MLRGDGGLIQGRILIICWNQGEQDISVDCMWVVKEKEESGVSPGFPF